LTPDQWIVFLVLGGTLLFFITGWLRYDLVALVALLALAVSGVLQPKEIFAGFSNEAVINIAAVLMMGRGLRESGVVEVLAERLGQLGERFGISLRLGLLGAATSLLSGFVSDVATLALFLPVATKLARKQKTSPGRMLMPLAAAAMLGGTLTLIGTSVNMAIAGYRAQLGGSGFGMFSFTPVSAGLVIVGLAFVALIGWRLLPDRSGGTLEEFKTEDYLTEVRVQGESKFIGKTIRELEDSTGGDIDVLTLLRDGVRRVAPSGARTLQEGDLLIVRGDPESLEAVIAHAGLVLEAQKQQKEQREEQKKNPDGEKAAHRPAEGTGEAAAPAAEAEAEGGAQIVEAVVMPRSGAAGRTAAGLRLRERYAINVLAISRAAGPLRARLRDIRFEAGDVLLLQGSKATLQQSFTDLGLLPLAQRELRLGQPRKALLAFLVFGLALLAATFHLFSVPVCLLGGAVAMILLRLLSLEAAYAALEGSVLVLIGAMLTVAGTLQSSGASKLIASPILALAQHLPPVGALALVYAVTMLIAAGTNYVATAVLMAPVVHSVAQGLGFSVDPFLMAVAYASVTAFMTPIGHPCNTLVLGPGGYRFSDYLRMGLPLSILTALTASLLIPVFWPFH
jgi:di/tricarboxylate transporter